MLRLVNVMEILVAETIEEILRAKSNICRCERCRLDMAAIALNKLSPKYVVTLEGEVLLRTSALKQQFKVDNIKAVTEAAEVVSKNPHHPREGLSER